MNGEVRLPRLLKFVLAPIVIVAVWELVIRRCWVPEGLVPSPSQVLDSWYVWIAGTSKPILSPYVDLPRPRTVEMTTARPFNAIKHEVLGLIREESLKAAAGSFAPITS